MQLLEAAGHQSRRDQPLGLVPQWRHRERLRPSAGNVEQKLGVLSPGGRPENSPRWSEAQPWVRLTGELRPVGPTEAFPTDSTGPTGRVRLGDLTPGFPLRSAQGPPWAILTTSLREGAMRNEFLQRIGLVLAAPKDLLIGSAPFVRPLLTCLFLRSGERLGLVAFGLVHHGLQGLAGEKAPQVLGKQGIVPLPYLFGHPGRMRRDEYVG